MANISENTMIFMLAAQMSNTFNATFKSAGGSVTGFQKQIQELNRAQADIAAYQKQQEAVEGTKKKLDTLRQQYDNIQREIQETEGFSASLENQLLSKQLQIDRTSESLERGTNKLDAMGEELQAAGVDTGRLAAESARLERELEEVQKEEAGAGSGAKSFGESAATAVTAVSQALVTAGIAKGLSEVKDAFMECVGIAGDFEASMSNVEALSGATEQELAALNAMAKELGATTKFTATEAADAMGYMAMAGWDAQQMLAGMDGVLQLAAASGEDLALVSDIVTDALTAFGLEAADCAHFSDVLAKTASSSNTSVSLMGETFRNVASIAGTLEYSIEDVSVMMGLMANSGIKGANAGTALKNTLNGLVSGVTLTGDALGEYEYRATKADGTMKTLDETIQELRGAFSQMTKTEQIENAQAIAGTRTYNGLLAILNATDEEYASLSSSINNCTGAAQKMAAVKMNNLNGDLTKMKSAWDALKTSIGEQFIPVMRKLYAAGAEVLNGVNQFVNKHPALVKALAAATAAFAVLATGIAAYSAIMKVAIPIMTLFSASIPGVNIFLGVTAAIAGLVAVIAAVTSANNDAIPSLNELTEAARSTKEAIGEANQVYRDTVTQTEATAAVANTYIGKLEELEAAGITTEEQQTKYNNTVKLLLAVMPELAEKIHETSDAFGNTTYEIEGGTAALRANTEELKKNALAQAYQEQITKLYSEYADVLIEAEKNSIGLTKAQYDLEAASQKYNDALDRMTVLSEEAKVTADEMAKSGLSYADSTQYLTQEYYDLYDSLEYIIQEEWEAQEAVDRYTKALEADAEATQEAQDAIALAEEAVRNLTGATEEATEAAAESEAQAKEVAAQTEALNTVIAEEVEQIEALVEAYNEAYDSALDSISGQYKLWDDAAKVVETSAGTINTALESQIAYWDNYNQNLEALRERTADIDGLNEVIASLADGSADSVNAIAGMASASDEDLATMVANYQELQAAQSATAESIADLKTNFSNEMDELQKNLVEDINGMNLSSEAEAAGRNTVQGFIDAANSMLPQVQAAYNRLASAATSALSRASGSVNLPGYATGTDNAEKGYAIVGEEGPEIVYMHGGEKVLTAEETRALAESSLARALPAYADGTDNAVCGYALVGENGAEAVATGEMPVDDSSIKEVIAIAPILMRAIAATEAISAVNAIPTEHGASYSIVISPAYTINGVSNTGEMEAVLRQHDEDLRDYILEVIEDANSDTARRAYS